MAIAFPPFRRRADYLRKVIAVENEGSPAEMQALGHGSSGWPRAAVEQIAATLALMDRCHGRTRSFAREALSPDVNWFSAGGARPGKSLLVCFCGVAHRMMLPVPVFLQLVPEDRFDVVVLKDPSRLGFLRGLAGFGPDLRAVVAGLDARLRIAGYTDVRCLGVSAGGAAALYAGILAGARCAVAIGGRHPAHGARPGGDDGLAPGLTGFEFDAAVGPLATTTTTRLRAAFGDGSVRDRDGAASLRHALPACELQPVGGVAEHNLLACLLASGGIAPFLDAVLLGDPAVVAPGRPVAGP